MDAERENYPLSRVSTEGFDLLESSPLLYEEKRDVYLLELNGTENSVIPFFHDANWRVHRGEGLRKKVISEGKAGDYLILVQFPDQPSQACFEELEAFFGKVNIILIALVSDACLAYDECREVISRYFFDYHKLPVDPPRLNVIIGHAFGMLEMARWLLNRATAALSDDLLIGSSQAMQNVKNILHKIDAVDTPVLITGESGTGKELAAHMIHNQSPRASNPFVAVNCAALPATLIYSELFGHEKGAFTGAHCRTKGRFELAQGGTIFLDEIGDLSLELQIVLLRVLDQKLLRRLGGTTDIPTDVRVIAATHVNLLDEIEAGRFREDLYFRLNVINLTLPPLREREEDPVTLANHFLDDFANSLGKYKAWSFSQEALKRIRSYTWPGNVRELINRVQQAAVLNEGVLITPEALGLERREWGRDQMTLKQARERTERRILKAALARSRHSVTDAAHELGVSRVTVYRLMEKYDLE